MHLGGFKAIGFHFLLLTAFIYGASTSSFPPISENPTNEDINSAVSALVIDIGSTGTRFCVVSPLPSGRGKIASVYRVTNISCYEPKDKIKPKREDLLPLLKIEDTRHIKQYITTYQEAEQTGAASKGWAPLRNALLTALPQDVDHTIPILLHATAGIREHYTIQAQKALKQVILYTLKEAGFTRVERISIIPGHMEGLFAWWGVNYALGRLLEHRYTCDVIEFGGKSAQLVRRVDPYMYWKDSSISLGFKKEPYFVRSYNNWGAEATWENLTSKLVGAINPCLGKGVKDDKNRTGIGDAQECRYHIKALFYLKQKGCTPDECSVLESGGKYLPSPLPGQKTVVVGQLAGATAVAVEKLWRWVTEQMNQPNHTLPEQCVRFAELEAPQFYVEKNHQMLLRSAAFCACSLDSGQTHSAFVGDRYATMRCFRINYLQLMLGVAFGIDYVEDGSFPFRLGLKLEDSSEYLSWPLGAAVHYSLWPRRWAKRNMDPDLVGSDSPAVGVRLRDEL